MSVKKNFFISTISKYLNLFINIIGTLFLTRLLTPEDFGSVAMVLIIQNFFLIFGDFGIGPAIISNNSLDKKDYNSIYAYSLIIGFALFILLFILGIIMKLSLGSNIFLYFIVGLNLFFFISSIVPQNYIRKQNNFFLISQIETYSVIISWGICIVLALMNFSYYAILLRILIYSLLLFVFCNYKTPIKINLTLSLIGIKKIFSFSLYQLLFNVVNFFARNLDQIFIKNIFSTKVLGLYNRSYQLMIMPVGNITGVISTVFLAHYSNSKKSKEDFIITYENLLKVLTIIGFSTGIVLFYFSEEIILLSYGNNWVEAIPIFRIMGILSGVQIILSLSGLGFQVQNDTKNLFKSGCVLVALIVINLAIFSLYSDILMITLSILIAYTLGGFWIFLILYKKTFQRKIINFAKVITLPFICYISIASLYMLFKAHLTVFYIKLISFLIFYFLLFVFPNFNLFQFTIRTLLKK